MIRRCQYRSTPNLDKLQAEHVEFEVNVSSELIGSGSQGSVLVAELHRLNRSPYFFAVKARPPYHMASGDTADHERALHMIAAKTTPMSSNQAGGILPYMGAMTTPQRSYLTHILHAMPLADGTLQQYLPQIQALKTSHHSLYQLVIYDFLMCILVGLEQLSEAQIVHNDFGTKNVLFYKNRWVISDFGQAETYSEFRSTTDRLRGSPKNMAPELLSKDKRFPFSRDIWALGQTLRAILGEAPIYHEAYTEGMLSTFFEYLKQIYRQQRHHESASPATAEVYQQSLKAHLNQQTNFDDLLTQFIKSMNEVLPEKRPSLSTFRDTCERMRQHLDAPNTMEPVLKAFYQSLVDNTSLRHRQIRSVSSDNIIDMIECDVIDFSTVSSRSSSPRLFQKTTRPQSRASSVRSPICLREGLG